MPHPEPKACIFEHIYFALPNSVVFGKSMYESRHEFGEILANEALDDCDVVIAVPDSGVVAALGYAAKAGVPFQQVFEQPSSSAVEILAYSCSNCNSFQVEVDKDFAPHIEELHLMGNKIREIKPESSTNIKGFDSLCILNLEDNCIADWDEILKLSQLRSLEQLPFNKNNLNQIRYPNDDGLHRAANGNESLERSFRPFENCCCLLLGDELMILELPITLLP